MLYSNIYYIFFFQLKKNLRKVIIAKFKSVQLIKLLNNLNIRTAWIEKKSVIQVLVNYIYKPIKKRNYRTL